MNEELSIYRYPLLKDVFGDDEFKEQLENIVLSMENQMLYHIMGIKAPKSYLFSGPTGTGKTFTVNAIANELSMRKEPMEALIHPYEVGVQGTAFINEGAKNIQKYFDQGREALLDSDNRVTDIIYWIDEADSVFSQRGNRSGHKEDDKNLNQFMLNLQHIDERQDSEYVFLATNFPDMLDDAATRTGRVHEVINFPLPNQDCRQALFEGYIDNINQKARYKVIRNFDTEELAKQSEGLSHSDIEAVVNDAVQNKITKELRNKPKGVIPAYWLGQNYINEALDKVTDRKTKYDRKPIGF